MGQVARKFRSFNFNNFHHSISLAKSHPFLFFPRVINLLLTKSNNLSIETHVFSLNEGAATYVNIMSKVVEILASINNFIDPGRILFPFITHPLSHDNQGQHSLESNYADVFPFP